MKEESKEKKGTAVKRVTSVKKSSVNAKKPLKVKTSNDLKKVTLDNNKNKTAAVKKVANKVKDTKELEKTVNEIKVKQSKPRKKSTETISDIKTVDDFEKRYGIKASSKSTTKKSTSSKKDTTSSSISVKPKTTRNVKTSTTKSVNTMTTSVKVSRSSKNDDLYNTLTNLDELDVILKSSSSKKKDVEDNKELGSNEVKPKRVVNRHRGTVSNQRRMLTDYTNDDSSANEEKVKDINKEKALLMEMEKKLREEAKRKREEEHKKNLERRLALEYALNEEEKEEQKEKLEPVKEIKEEKIEEQKEIVKEEPKKEKKTKNKKKVSIFGRIWNTIKILFLFFGVVSSIIFVGKIIHVKLIPNKFIIIGSLVLLIINLILMLMCFSRKKIINFIQILFSTLIGCVFIVAINMVGKTFNILKDLIESNVTMTSYYVLVKSESTYESYEQLNHVALLDKGSDKVIEQLNHTDTITYDKEISIGNLLVNLDLDQVQAIIVNISVYDFINEDEANKGKYKILYEFSVEGEDESVDSSIDVNNSFVIYISGMDSRGELPAYGLSDVNMLAVVNPDTHKVLLINTPRDYYVQIPGTTGYKEKLTHAGLYGVDVSIATMESIYGVDVNAYIKVGFGFVTTIVDEIDGIDVYSDIGFNSFHLPGWYVPKGMVHMNGKQALAFSRERYAYASGDRHRGQNQQAVITAIINKVASNPKYLSKYADILSAVQPYIVTNVNMDDVQTLVRTQIETLSPWTVESISVNGTNGNNVTASWPTQYTYVMIPDQSTIDAAKTKIAEVMRG